MDDDIDIEKIKKDLQKRHEEMSRDAILQCQEEINAFKDLCEKRGLSLNDNHFSYVQTTGVIVRYPNLLQIINPDLMPDKEGLIDTSILTKNFTSLPMMGSYNSDIYSLLVHPFFRRGHAECNHFPPSFIPAFCSFRDNATQAFISLDMNRIRIGKKPHIYMEADYWYGPKFQNSIEDIPDGNAKYVPPSWSSSSTMAWIFHDNYALIIKWETKENIKTFQAKAFKNDDKKIEYQGYIFHPVQYLHAEYDLEKKNFRHFDGAIHLHTNEEYINARDLDFNHREKIDRQIKPKSIKLFKLNGEISTDTWGLFVGEFLSGNPLITEYFTGDYPAHTKETLERLSNRPEAH